LNYFTELNKIKFNNLESFNTKDILDGHSNGSLTVIWREYDKIISNNPKMIYVTSVKAGEIKGPHLHTKRHSSFVCIRGKVVFIIKDKNGEYVEKESSEENPVLVQVPKNYPSAHINITNQLATILTLADVAWKPNDNEMQNVEFKDYDWGKWKNIV
jgi:dTDP-4-dehydrorhamnose 3,5-epimerase